MKIVQINGFRGLLVAAFMGVCLVAGFVFFPGIMAMKLWNHFLTGFPVLNVFQGILLWGMVAICYFILFSQKEMPVSLKSVSGLSDRELDKIMEKAKIHAQFIKASSLIPPAIKSEERKEEKEEISNHKND